MCAAAARLPHLHLGHQNKFHYLNQGNNPFIDGVDDLVCFDETITALTMLGFSSKQQDDMLRILAAIIHLGNVNIGNCDNQTTLNNENDTETSYIHVNIDCVSMDILLTTCTQLIVVFSSSSSSFLACGQTSFNDVRVIGHRCERDEEMAVP